MRWWTWLRARLRGQRPPAPPPRQANGLPPDPLPEVTEIRQRLTVPAAKAQLWERALEAMDARERTARYWEREAIQRERGRQ